jgi:hypothetical protein
MTGADRAIRYSTIAAVVIVAAVAASFSYQHAPDVIGQYSRPDRLNLVFPLDCGWWPDPARVRP